MGSRSRKILMMLNDDIEIEKTEEIYEPQIDNIPATFVEDQHHKAITTSNTNSLMNISTKTMVETWIDNNDFENQDPNFMESNVLEADHSYTMNESPGVKTKAINEPLLIHELHEAMTPSKLISIMANVETMTEDNPNNILEAIPTANAPSGNTIEADSSNAGDFSPSEGSEYKFPRRAKPSKRLIKPINPTSSSSSSSLSSSDSSSSSSSDSSLSETVHNTAEVEINESNMEPEPALSLNEESIEPESSKRQSRKRQKNPHEWKQVISKRLKNSGQEYTTKRGKLVPAKSMLPPCKDKCRLSCSAKVSSEIRKNIFDAYWELGTHQRQRDFLASCVKNIQPATRRIKVTVGNPCNKQPRKPKSTYYFIVNGKEVRVCKIFLLNTLSIGEKTIQNVIDKMPDNPLFMAATDNRGKHGKNCKLSAELIQSVRDHINSIPRTESHYLRAKTNREYIDGSLTVAELHRKYEKLRHEAGKEAVNYDAYYRIFNTDFNIGLYVPRKDQCDECEAYKNAIDKEPLSAKHKLHLEEKILSRLELKKDTNQCSNSTPFHTTLPVRSSFQIQRMRRELILVFQSTEI